MKVRVIAILLLALTLWADQIYFLPYDSSKAFRAITRAIDHARSSIDIAMYSFTNKKLAKKIKNAAKRGVRVRILLDEKQNLNDRYSQIGYLAKYRNIAVYTIRGRAYKKGGEFGKMHIKLAIIDKKTLIFGSANWSMSAFFHNYELIYLRQDLAMAKKSTAYFERMLRSAERY